MMKKINTVLFLTQKTFEDIINPGRFGVSQNYKISNDNTFVELPYALNFTSENMLKYYRMKVDNNGIVMTPHYIGNNASKTHYYSYLKIAHYLLGAYNDYLKSPKDSYVNIIKKQANYLLENAEHFNGNKNVLVWRTRSGVSRYGVKPNHVSGIVQGLIVSAMVRAYLLFEDEQFLDAANKALNILDVPVNEGGVKAYSQWGVCYEEYPRIPYIHVVNGFIFCLMGIHDYYLVTKSEKAENLYFQGVETLKKMLPDWILPYWSKYDLCDITDSKPVNLSTRHYQYLHADQLKIIFEQTKDYVFQEYHQMLEKQIKNPVNIVKAYLNKIQNINIG